MDEGQLRRVPQLGNALSSTGTPSVHSLMGTEFGGATLCIARSMFERLSCGASFRFRGNKGGPR